MSREPAQNRPADDASIGTSNAEGPAFATHVMVVSLGGREIFVHVEADALQFWWGGDTGPQSAVGLVADHRAEIDAIVAAKVAQGHVEPDGTVIVRDDDLE